MDLSLRVDENAAKEQDETSDGEDKGGYELQIKFHIIVLFSFDGANIYQKRGDLQIFAPNLLRILTKPV